MSQLYSTFAQLVSVHCKMMAGNSGYTTTVGAGDSLNIHLTMPIPVNQCKHDLLNYGYERLQNFSDNQLDAFDPFQRGANELRKSQRYILLAIENPNSLMKFLLFNCSLVVNNA